MSEESKNKKRVEITVFVNPNRLDESAKKKDKEDYKIEDFKIEKLEIYEDGALYLEAFSKKSDVAIFLEIDGDEFLRLLGECKYRLFKAIEDRQRRLDDAKDILDKV